MEMIDDECIDDLKDLERSMYMLGDSRSEVLRRVLDCLYINEVIDDVYQQPRTTYKSEVV